MRFSVPRYWREREARYRLKATRCKDCGRVNYPPSQVCRYCGSRNVETIYLDREKAKLLSWTIIYTAPYGFEERRPLIIGLVKTLESKARILAPITDVLPEELKKDMILEPVLRRVNEDREAGLIHYGIAYRPVIKS
jgi:uncharacterized OB-fold protein